MSVRESINLALDETPVTPNRRRMWALASAGIGLSGYDFFIMSAALPLIQANFGTFSPTIAGFFAAAAFLGAVPGAIISGVLSDRYGRRLILLIDVALLTITSILCAIAWSPFILIFFRFLQGISVGAEYPISASLVGEIMPRKSRGKWMTGAFSFQAIGMTLAAAICSIILLINPSEQSWRWMLLSCAVPALILAVLRTSIRESPRWLARKGRLKEAKDSLFWLIGAHILPVSKKKEEEPQKSHLKELFRKEFRMRTIFTAVPWFLMDIALYGIGLFTPMILVYLLHPTAIHTSGFIAADFRADMMTVIADIFLIFGFALNIFFVERRGRVQLQILGFIGMAIGTGLIGIFGMRTGDLALILGFSIFNLMVNFGPNATTFLLPVEVFPTRLRATGHGFAAACGKTGATFGVFFLPMAFHALGLRTTMISVGILCLIGAMITVVARVETKGLALE
ncbi:MAG TPA: MFS transporter [Chlamydiales bacterium]|nr:MFS transporter [Chlamydiales bacterium]